jgi:hypothetical protein
MGQPVTGVSGSSACMRVMFLHGAPFIWNLSKPFSGVAASAWTYTDFPVRFPALLRDRRLDKLVDCRISVELDGVAHPTAIRFSAIYRASAHIALSGSRSV